MLWSCFGVKKGIATLEQRYEDEPTPKAPRSMPFIEILTFMQGQFDLQSLFPTSNIQQPWVHVVIGFDKAVISYVDTLGFTEPGSPNKRFEDVLKGSYVRFFDFCFDLILTGCGNSFLFLLNGQMHLATMFSYLSVCAEVTGGAVYIRSLTTTAVTDAYTSERLRTFTKTRNSNEFPMRSKETTRRGRKNSVCY